MLGLLKAQWKPARIRKAAHSDQDTNQRQEIRRRHRSSDLGVAFRYSQKKAGHTKAQKRFLALTLGTLIAEEIRTDGVFTQDIRECKGRNLELLKKGCRGAMIRSRTLFLNRGEKSSKIFKTKEQQHSCRSRISKLQVGEGLVTRKLKALSYMPTPTYLRRWRRIRPTKRAEEILSRISEAVRKQTNHQRISTSKV